MLTNVNRIALTAVLLLSPFAASAAGDKVENGPPKIPVIDARRSPKRLKFIRQNPRTRDRARSSRQASVNQTRSKEMSIGKTYLSQIVGAGVLVITLAFASSAWSQKQHAAPSNEPAYYTSATTPLFNPYPNVNNQKSQPSCGMAVNQNNQS